MWIGVHRVVEEVPADAAIVQQGVALGRRAIRGDGLTLALQVDQQRQQRTLGFADLLGKLQIRRIGVETEVRFQLADPGKAGALLPRRLFAAGEQARVPLLAGWNSAEVPYQSVMGRDTPTPENYAKKIKQFYPDHAEEVLKLYPGNTQEEVIKSATGLGSDRFIAYGTWKWTDLQAKTGGKPVYRYLFSCPRPPMVGAATNPAPGKMPAPLVGASHASEIEFAMGNLPYNKVYAWTADDYKVSATMENYFANFIKTGNPNGPGLPKWEPNTKDSPVKFINIDVNTHLESETNRARYLFLDKEYFK